MIFPDSFLKNLSYIMKTTLKASLKASRINYFGIIPECHQFSGKNEPLCKVDKPVNSMALSAVRADEYDFKKVPFSKERCVKAPLVPAFFTDVKLFFYLLLYYVL